MDADGPMPGRIQWVVVVIPLRLSVRFFAVINCLLARFMLVVMMVIILVVDLVVEVLVIVVFVVVLIHHCSFS